MRTVALRLPDYPLTKLKDLNQASRADRGDRIPDWSSYGRTFIPDHALPHLTDCLEGASKSTLRTPVIAGSMLHLLRGHPFRLNET